MSTTALGSHKPKRKRRIIRKKGGSKSTECLVREVNSTSELFQYVEKILTKIKFDQYVDLLRELKKFNIDSREKMNGLVDILVGKSIMQPEYSRAVVQLFAWMYKHNVSSTSNKLQFREKFVQQCLAEFAHRNNKANNATDLLGEVYLEDFITTKVVIKCLHEMLKTPTPEQLVDICRLMRNIGRKLKSDTHEKCSNVCSMCGALEHVMDRIILQGSRMTMDARKKLHELIDLHNNAWLPLDCDC